MIEMSVELLVSIRFLVINVDIPMLKSVFL